MSLWSSIPGKKQTVAGEAIPYRRSSLFLLLSLYVPTLLPLCLPIYPINDCVLFYSNVPLKLLIPHSQAAAASLVPLQKLFLCQQQACHPIQPEKPWAQYEKFHCVEKEEMNGGVPLPPPPPSPSIPSLYYYLFSNIKRLLMAQNN